MTAPSYDASQWPIFRVTMPKDGATDNELNAHVMSIEGRLQKGERFALLIDARNAKPLDARGRQALGQMLRRAFQRDPHVLAGLGVVLSSAVERGVLTAIIWAAGRTYPQRTFAEPAEAATWLRTMLAAPDPRRAGER
jgi:hypothetical protein